MVFDGTVLLKPAFVAEAGGFAPLDAGWNCSLDLGGVPDRVIDSTVFVCFHGIFSQLPLLALVCRPSRKGPRAREARWGGLRGGHRAESRLSETGQGRATNKKTRAERKKP